MNFSFTCADTQKQSVKKERESNNNDKVRRKKEDKSRNGWLILV